MASLPPQGSALDDHPAPTHLADRPWLEELWDSHSVSVYTLAWALLGDDASAARAVSRGLSDLTVAPGRASGKDALRSWARQVYLRSQEIGDPTTRPPAVPAAMTWLRQLALPQRTCVALCLFGGHTSREVATLLGVAPRAVADLLRTGLGEAERLAAGGNLGRA